MTKRLPNALKKKLEASLENLTPRQAGRLLLIYAHEHDKKDDSSTTWAYPPIVELNNVFLKRIETAKKKGDAAEREAVGQYNGFVTLGRLIHKLNVSFGDSEIWRLYLRASIAKHRLTTLILQDFQSEIARETVGHFIEDFPRPLSWEEYVEAVSWYQTNDPVDLGELANNLTRAWQKEKGYSELLVPLEFLKTNGEPSPILGDSLEEDNLYFEEAEDLRRKWVETEGKKKILSTYFAGDQDRLEAWILSGGAPEFNGKEWDQKADEIYDHMVEMVESGELQGGWSYSLINNFSAVISKDWKKTGPDNLPIVKIPAWAALRSIWAAWLYDQGIFSSDEFAFDVEYPDPIHKYFDAEGPIEGDRLAETAKKFYSICRKKIWGAGLIDPKKVNFAELGRFLCGDESPILGYIAPDLGWVEVEKFGEVEGTDPFMTIEGAGQPIYYATLQSLWLKAEEMGFNSEEMGNNLIREFYYPADNPKEKRRGIVRLFRQMSSIQVSHRPFTYREKGKRDLPSFLGLKFFTPLEDAIKNLGEVFDEVATSKAVAEAISNEFFDGISPFLYPLDMRLKDVENTLKETEDLLNSWLDLLDSDIWNIDISRLRLVKKGPNEELVKSFIAQIFEMSDDDRDKPTRPAFLDNGETFEQVLTRMTGLTYISLDKRRRSR